MVLHIDGHDRLRPVAALQHERGVEGAEAVQVRRVEAPGRVLEADLPHRAGRVGPPGVHGPVGEREVGGEVAEEVERQRRRPEEVGPDALVIHGLVRLDRGRARPRRLQRSGSQEGRAGLARVVQWQAAADGPGGPPRLRRDRLRPDGMPLRLAPERLLVAQRASELGHPGSAWDAILGLPAACGLELLLRERLAHSRARRLARRYALTQAAAKEMGGASTTDAPVWAIRDATRARASRTSSATTAR